MCNIGTNDVPEGHLGRIIETMMQQPSPSGVPSSGLHASVLRRIAAEFREMPGLVLTVPQASRLLGVDQAACEGILARLVQQGILRRSAGGSYARA
jgi:hypothetical protein